MYIVNLLIMAGLKNASALWISFYYSPINVLNNNISGYVSWKSQLHFTKKCLSFLLNSCLLSSQFQFFMNAHHSDDPKVSSNQNNWHSMILRDSFEFSLNDFPWIQWIQWIVTKSKSSMVTRGITHLATDTLPMLVIQSVFSLLPLGRYLLPLTTTTH